MSKIAKHGALCTREDVPSTPFTLSITVSRCRQPCIPWFALQGELLLRLSAFIESIVSRATPRRAELRYSKSWFPLNDAHRSSRCSSTELFEQKDIAPEHILNELKPVNARLSDVLNFQSYRLRNRKQCYDETVARLVAKTALFMQRQMCYKNGPPCCHPISFIHNPAALITKARAYLRYSLNK